MNKKLIWFLFFVLLLFWGSFNYTNSVQEPINRFFNLVKTTYHDTLTSTRFSIQKHFAQSQMIEELQKNLNHCKTQNLYIQQYKHELQNLYKLHNTPITFDPKAQLVRAISYEKFGDMNRLWLEAGEYNSSKVYGLVFGDSVAGIVIPKDGMPLALLLRDPKSSFAVYIGNTKAPGIAHGNNDENIVVTFIPTWYNIEVGDEVVTSGLDNLFFEGLKVGKVLSISTSQGYKKALVHPYYTQTDLNYFYMILSPK